MKNTKQETFSADISLNWIQNIVFTFLHWFPNAIYSKRFPNSFCVHFFDIHVDSEKYTFILYSFKKITNDGSKIHVRFRDIYLLSISPKMGKMLLPFSWRCFLVYNNFHLNISHLHFQFDLSSRSLSICCRRSLTKCRWNFICMEPLVQIRIRSDDDLRCHSSKDAVSLINEEEKRHDNFGSVRTVVLEL